MKQVLLLFLLVGLPTLLFGQERELRAAEYFINEDPGLGNGNAISVSAGTQATLDVDIDVSQLPAGRHYIGLRTRDDRGRWSAVRVLPFIVEPVGTPVISQPDDLLAAEYFIGTDPGLGNATPILVQRGAMQTDDILVDVSALSPGKYFMSVRGMNSQGNWGAVRTIPFFVEAVQDPTPSPVVTIRALEYFFGDDPGLGNATRLELDSSVRAELDIAIPTEGLTPGNYTLHFRTETSGGLWSPLFSRSFEIIDVLDGIQALSPAEGAEIRTVLPRLSWSSLPEATDYELQVATDAGFENLVQAEILADTSLRIGPLAYVTTYFWRVRPLDQDFRGPWTPTRQFTTGFFSPGDVTLRSPADTTDNVPLDVILTWYLAERSDFYEVQIATDVGFSQIVNASASGQEETSGKIAYRNLGKNGDHATEMQPAQAFGSYHFDGYAFATTYFWRVRGSNEYGLGEWSDSRQFTTTAAPETPLSPLASAVLQSPADNASDVEIPVVLRWDPVSDADFYVLELASDAAFNTRTTWDSLSVTQLAVPALTDTTLYYWRVRAISSDRTNSVSQTWSFVTELRLPETPVWQPADGAVEQDTAIVLRWTPIVRASAYDVELSTDANFTITVQLRENLALTETEIDGLSQGTTYFWRIRGVNERGVGAWSEPLQFTTLVISSIDDPGGVDVPTMLQLDQNYPNPFNPVTLIRYALPESGTVRLTVYDLLGREVAVLVDRDMPAGSHEARFDASAFGSGVYVYRLSSAGVSITRKMTLVK